MLELSIALPIRVQNGGLFISRGVGSHPSRTLDSWEAIFVEKGTLTIREEDKIFTVKSGESLLLWPQRRHVGVGEFPADLKFYWLHFELTPAVEKKAQQSVLMLPQHTTLSDPQYMTGLFRQFLNEQENVHRSVALECILLLILQQISASALSENAGNNPGIALAWKARQMIGTHFHLPISASLLAKELHCNVDYLGRVYRRAFRLTLTEAIHRQRVRAAEKLLISDSLSLKEVAEQCGFSRCGLFSANFPQAYRHHARRMEAAVL
ncbi:DNA-binding transcriptional regulator AraC [Raoultella terrigena]|uniref:DNA-binding transcriptional regulator AraC n=1 Tax=Raoultella terrigena TaxID=577 RepID=A0A3P8LXQ6_RAOTE|nr:DNA-binding transcriptional regulator AraC [Raoultella terrigena]